MATLRFKIDDNLKQILNHAKQGPWKDCYSEKITVPTFFLVHDEGVYLMSAAKADNPEPDRKEGSERQRVAYAEGCNPKSDTDWYETARELVGGDDFGDPVTLGNLAERIEGKKELVIKLTKRRPVSWSETKLSVRLA